MSDGTKCQSGFFYEHDVVQENDNATSVLPVGILDYNTMDFDVWM